MLKETQNQKLQSFKPSDFQLKFDEGERLFDLKSSRPYTKENQTEGTQEDRLFFDVLFVGAGPSGLAGAIELSRLVKEHKKEVGEVSIGVIEKAPRLGAHNLSGAILNPSSLMELFPDLGIDEFPFRGGRVKKEKFYFLSPRKAFRFFLPPPMRNSSCYILSLSELLRWMGEKAQDRGVDILTSFSAQALLMEKDQVVGIRSKASGLNRENLPGPNYTPSFDVHSKITVLAEGSRGFLTEAYLKREKISSSLPQIYSLGVKELWRTKTRLSEVIHTMNWPLPNRAFGGSFIYPMGKNLVSLGIVVGLDAPYKNLDGHSLLQEFKMHPLVQKILKGGEIQEWGAKTIPEGGFYSIPKRLSGDGVLIVGDSAGLVNVPSLKGIHYAIQSGIYAARSIFEALKAKDYSKKQLNSYDERLRSSYILKELERVRNVREAFRKGLYTGSLKAALMILTKGMFPKLKELSSLTDASIVRSQQLEFPLFKKALKDKNPLVFRKSNGVYFSKNKTRDDIPVHLRGSFKNLPLEVQSFYESFCPAQVYEKRGDQFVVQASNCIDCKATDILGPQWFPREGGSGPEYHLM